MAAYNAASRAGGSLDLLQGIYGDAMGAATDRYNTNQETQQTAMDNIMAAAQGGIDRQGLNAMVDAYGAMSPYLENNPKASGALNQLVHSAIPQGQSVSPFAVSDAGGGGGGLAEEDFNNAAASAAGAAEQGLDLHTARMQYMMALRGSGMPEDQMQQLYNMFGTSFQNSGGNMAGVSATGVLPGMGAGPGAANPASMRGVLEAGQGPSGNAGVTGGALDALSGWSGGFPGVEQPAIDQAAAQRAWDLAHPPQGYFGTAVPGYTPPVNDYFGTRIPG
jgi:hypothetical protein